MKPKKIDGDLKSFQLIDENKVKKSLENENRLKKLQVVHPNCLSE